MTSHDIGTVYKLKSNKGQYRVRAVHESLASIYSKIEPGTKKCHSTFSIGFLT